MTDLTLGISAALRDAQLQRLEAALASKVADQHKHPHKHQKNKLSLYATDRSLML